MCVQCVEILNNQYNNDYHNWAGLHDKMMFSENCKKKKIAKKFGLIVGKKNEKKNFFAKKTGR